MTEIQTLDIEFFGTTGLVASFLAPADGGFVLFDPGPASAVKTLEKRIERAGFALGDLRGVFATHVHLDHAGGAGVLSRQTGCPVFVHPVGAPHLVDPGSKLLPSAERLYGDMMEPLWGTTVGVPEESAHPVADGEVVKIGGLEVVAWHTPGHAVHHVAWQIGDALAAGDIAGVRFPGAYEAKLQEKQLTEQKALLARAAAEVEAELEASRIQRETAAEVARVEAEVAMEVERLRAASQSEISAIELAAERHRSERAADSAAERDRHVAAGELALARAEALREELLGRARATAGGRLWLAREAARNLHFERIALDSSDPRVPTFLDLDEVVALLVGRE